MGIFTGVFKKNSFKDPVCGMATSDAISAEFNGQTYYFCSAHCKQEFEAAPEKYINN